MFIALKKRVNYTISFAATTPKCSTYFIRTIIICLHIYSSQCFTQSIFKSVYTNLPCTSKYFCIGPTLNK